VVPFLQPYGHENAQNQEKYHGYFKRRKGDEIALDFPNNEKISPTMKGGWSGGKERSLFFKIQAKGTRFRGFNVFA